MTNKKEVAYMNAQEKYESLDKTMQSLDKLPMPLNITKEDRKMLSIWISRAVATTYDKGFEDGQISK
jgi:hypothetical protein